MRIGSLFSGAGGLDMAVEAVFGGQTVWHCEVDKAASKVLAYRWPGVPNLGSVTDIDWKCVPPVDVLCGGFPCTDVSAAGKRAGMHGTRSGLWSHMAEAIDVLRPQYVVIENVRGLLNADANRPVGTGEDVVGYGGDGPVLRAIGAVLGDVADIGGYEARWVTLAAGDIGAPHRRERVFIVAYADADEGRRGGRWEASRGDVGGHNEIDGRWRGESPAGRCGPTPDSQSDGWDEGRPESAGIVGGFDAAVRSDGPVNLLPTPCVVDRLATGEMTLDEWDESRRAQKEKGVGSFGPRGDSLGAAVLRVDQGVIDERPDYSTTKARSRRADQLLPTPRSSDCFGAGLHGDGGMDLRTTVTLLPTPTVGDGTGGGRRNQVRDGNTFANDSLRDAVLSPVASQWGKYEPAIRRWEALTRPAPAPTEPNKNGNPRLAAAFSEWLMGWPDGWVTDPAIGISRNDQLRIIGNGVCPAQAASALRYLLAVGRGNSVGRPTVDSERLLPTPCARDWKDGEFPATHARNTPSLGAISAYFGEDA